MMPAAAGPVARRGGLARLIGGKHAELRQAARVMIGAGAAFVAYKLLGFEQGYWAVFTVVIVLQGSIGGTLGAAVDRLFGTIAGAVLGAVALMLTPATTLGTAVALGVVTGITALAAAVRPQLRVAPVTAAIVLLSHVPGVSPERFALDRVLEIALGGVIGVLTSLFVFPARSRGVVVARVSSALVQCEKLLGGAAAAFDGDGDAPGMAAHAPLRRALVGIEAAMQDAERERQSRLGEHGIPPAVPRTLWRIRNDIVHVTRGLEDPLPDPVAQAFGPVAAGLLRAEADYAERCRLALGEAHAVERGDVAERYAEFVASVEGLRQSRLTRGMDFAVVGRLFGLIFALEQLHRNLSDLADRIDEAAAAPARRRLFARR